MISPNPIADHPVLDIAGVPLVFLEFGDLRLVGV
jgi:hypothetical protein